MRFADFESGLQSVVVGIGIIGHPQDVIVLRKSRTERLASVVASQRTDWTGIHIAPGNEVTSGSAHISDADCHLVVQFLLNREVVGVIHRRLEIGQHLHNVKRRTRSNALAIDVNTGRHANEKVAQ